MYNGYLLKIGNYEFPSSLIKAESYMPYINTQVLEPWTDANGYEHTNFVDLEAIKVEFETIPMLTNTQFSEIMRNINANIIPGTKRKCYVQAYIPVKDEYVTQLAYMVDIKPTLYGTYNGEIHYNAIRIAFVGGIADD